MKRIISLILAAALMLCSVVPVCAAEQDESGPICGLLPVCRVSSTDVVDYISVMYQDGFVYAELYEFAEYLGYKGKDGEDCAILTYEENVSTARNAFKFYYDSTDVDRIFLTRCIKDAFVAPCKTIKNDNGIWIPLDYTVALVGGELWLDVENGKAVITPPGDSFEWVIWQVMGQSDRYRFDWTDDYELNDELYNSMANAAELVQLFNGVLNLDGDAWEAMFMLYLDPVSSAMDDEFGEELAVLMCTSSDREYLAAADQLDDLSELTNKDSAVIEALKAMEDVKSDDISALMYQYGIVRDSTILDNDTRQALQSRISKRTRNAFEGLQLCKDLEIANSIFSTSMTLTGKVLELGCYIYEFRSQDEFALDAFSQYLEETENYVDMSEAMLEGMAEYLEDQRGNLATFTASQLIEHGIEDVAVGGFAAFLGLPATVALAGWSIAGNCFPPLKNGLDSTKQFQLSLYGTILQHDAFMYYVEKRQRSMTGDITPSEVKEMAAATYVYLKSCYLTREAAISCLSSGMEEAESDTAFAMDRSINEEIAIYLSVLKMVTEDSATYYRGFLPEDNRLYLQNCDDTNLAALILLEPYASYLAKIQEVKEEYGEPCYNENNGAWMSGLCFVKLLDFDQDGMDELLLSYKKSADRDVFDWTVEVYTFNLNTRSVVSLYSGDGYTSGYLYSQCVAWTKCEEQYYLITGLWSPANSGYGLINYYGIKDGEMVLVHHVDFNYHVDRTLGYCIDGETVPSELVSKRQETWTKKAEYHYYSYPSAADYLAENMIKKSAIENNIDGIFEKAKMQN